MTEEELMEIARPFAADGGRWPSDWLAAMKAAVSAEREACAKVCDGYDNGRHANAANICADAIRARSNC